MIEYTASMGYKVMFLDEEKCVLVVEPLMQAKVFIKIRIVPMAIFEQ